MGGVSGVSDYVVLKARLILLMQTGRIMSEQGVQQPAKKEDNQADQEQYLGKAIVDIFKKLLEINSHTYGIKKNF